MLRYPLMNRLGGAPMLVMSGRRLAQRELPPITAATMEIRDLDRPVTADEWTAQTWTKDEAIAAFNVTNLLWSLREKIAFSAVLFRNMMGDPRILAAINRTEQGPDFGRITTGLITLSKQLSLPNMMSSVRNLLTALEIRILPRFGIGIKGMRPLFRDQKTLDCTRVETVRADRPETIDFGDMCKTSIIMDVNALQAATETAITIAPEVKLSGPPLPVLAVFLIKLGAWLAAILIVGWGVVLPAIDSIAKLINPVLNNPDVLKIIDGLKSTDPVKAAQMLNDLQKANSFWEAASNVAMWLGIGAGAIGLAWVIYLLTRPSPKLA